MAYLRMSREGKIIIVADSPELAQDFARKFAIWEWQFEQPSKRKRRNAPIHRPDAQHSPEGNS